MLDSAILEVAIGLAFVFLIFSLLVSAASELLAGWLKWRSRYLWDGICHLVQSDEARDRLYDHPLIKGLARVDPEKPDWRGGRRGPSYIPSRTFALALIDILGSADGRPGGKPAGTAAAGDAPRSMTRTLAALAPLLHEAGDDAERFRQNVETWFNDGMDRVSGWYKRHTAYWQGAIALAIAVLLNVDALLITRTLWREPTLRQSLVAGAEAHEAAAARQQATVAGEGAVLGVAPAPDTRFDELQSQMSALGVPIGWSCEEDTIANWLWCAGRRSPEARGATGRPASAALSPRSEQGWLAMIVGWLIMAAAASLGAPFWFDTLKRVMSVRSGGKSPDEQPFRRTGGSPPR